MNTKPESINIFTWCIHSPVSLNRCHSVYRSVLNAYIVLKCLFSECLFCIEFAIYNYISSWFAYDAFKPFIYCMRQKKHQPTKMLSGHKGRQKNHMKLQHPKCKSICDYVFWWKWAATVWALLRADYWLCRYFAMRFVDVPLSLRSRV